MEKCNGGDECVFECVCVFDMRPDYYKVRVLALVDGQQGKKKMVTLECFDLIDALGGGFYFGNALKYLFRFGRKAVNTRDDIKKIITYAKQMLERTDRQHPCMKSRLRGIEALNKSRLSGS